MTENSFMDYGLHPAIRQDFLNAIHQADCASGNSLLASQQAAPAMASSMSQKPEYALNTMGTNVDSDFLSNSMQGLTSNIGENAWFRARLKRRLTIHLGYQDLPLIGTQASLNASEVFSSTTYGNTPVQDDWFSQQSRYIESITPPLPSESTHPIELRSPLEIFRQTTAIVILTTETLANAPLLSHLFHSLSPFLHRSLLYIDDLAHYQPPPPTSNIVYLIWLHHFDAPLRQALDTAVLAHLHAHARHFFLVLNAPSQLLVEHLHSTAMDKQSVLVLNYHSTSEHELVLLCSGHRGTFELVRSSLLECVCPKVKYIESTDQQAFSAYTVASVLQSANALNHFVDRQIQQTLNERFDSNFLRQNQSVIDELFPSAQQAPLTLPTNQRSLVQTMHADALNDKPKQATMMHDLFQNKVIQTRTAPPICQYFLQSVLDEH